MDFKYRKILKTVDENMMTRDLNLLKFLCRDLIPVGKMEKAQKPRDVFQELEYRGFLGPGDKLLFLAELLDRIQRIDLIKKLGLGTSKEVQAKLQSGGRPGPQFSPYRLLLMDICQHLTTEDLASMKFDCHGIISKSRLQQIEDPASLLATLEQNDQISADDMSLMEEMMESLGNDEIKKKIQHYNARIRSALNADAAVAYQPMETEEMVGVTAPHMTAMPYQNPSQEPPYAVPPSQSKTAWAPVSSQEHYGSATQQPHQYQPQFTSTSQQPNQYQPQFTGTSQQPNQYQPQFTGTSQQPHQYQPQFTSTTQQPNQPAAATHRPAQVMAPASARQEQVMMTFDDMPRYPMNTQPLGICVIFNIEKFNKDTSIKESKELKDRHGSTVDMNKLYKLFVKLGFKVKVKMNLTSTAMLRLMEDEGRADHSMYSCFVCCILSHGAKDKVYGSDGVALDISDLTSCVKGTRCRSLNGKPKLFFMQACQGIVHQDGVWATDGPEPRAAYSVPNEADFLLGYATAPGFVSYRSKTQGSWFISMLTHCIERYHDKYDLMSIMVKVNEEVSGGVAEMGDDKFKQVPAPLVTLRKKVYL
ncbi:caspase-8-like [Glandiceps talaboti]